MYDKYERISIMAIAVHQGGSSASIIMGGISECRLGGVFRGFASGGRLSGKKYRENVTRNTLPSAGDKTLRK